MNSSQINCSYRGLVLGWNFSLDYCERINMNKKIINGLEYLEQNYRPSDIQKILDNSKTKREVYQGLKVSEYGLNKYIDRKSTRLNSSHIPLSRMPSSA